MYVQHDRWAILTDITMSESLLIVLSCLALINFPVISTRALIHDRAFTVENYEESFYILEKLLVI